LSGTLNTFSLNNYKINGPGSGENIKSIQSGVISSIVTAVATASINEIDQNKSIAFSNARTHTEIDLRKSSFSTSLSSSSVTFTRFIGNETATISYQIFEFNNVLSKQVVTGINLDNITSNVTINAVNIDKTLVFLDFTSTTLTADTDTFQVPVYYLSSTTNLFVRFGSSASRTGVAQILELT
jgi:hypothetical protein